MVQLIRCFLVVLLFFFNITFAQEGTIMNKQTFNSTLHNQLPARVLESKQIIAVNFGTLPPYVIYEEDGTLTGASVDLFKAISEILGVSIKYEITNGGFAGVLMGVQTGRYDLNIGPMGDIPNRRINHDLIAYSISYPAAAVLKGNPANIHTWEDFCGKRAAVTSGGIGEKRLEAQSERCVKKGKPPVNMLVFKDQPTMILALKSGRVDVFSTGVAAISYFVGNSSDKLDMVSLRDDKEGDRYFCAVVAKDSPLGPVILAALEELYANGTYAEIMKKWHMEVTILDKPGINLAK